MFRVWSQQADVTIRRSNFHLYVNLIADFTRWCGKTKSMAEFTEVESSISHILKLLHFMILLALDTIKWAICGISSVDYRCLKKWSICEFLFRSLSVW